MGHHVSLDPKLFHVEVTTFRSPKKPELCCSVLHRDAATKNKAFFFFFCFLSLLQQLSLGSSAQQASVNKNTPCKVHAGLGIEAWGYRGHRNKLALLSELTWDLRLYHIVITEALKEIPTFSMNLSQALWWLFLFLIKLLILITLHFLLEILKSS